jgi:3-isopropylmalate/(R)-2-methylmalate dehydratase small subunit
MTIDLTEQSLSIPGHTCPFQIDAESRAMLLSGLDAIDLTLQHAGLISKWQAQDRKVRPWVYL